VKLPSTNFDYLGYRAYVSGWGIQSPKDEGPSKLLKAAELVVRTCLDKQKTKFKKNVTERCKELNNL